MRVSSPELARSCEFRVDGRQFVSYIHVNNVWTNRYIEGQGRSSRRPGRRSKGVETPDRSESTMFGRPHKIDNGKRVFEDSSFAIIPKTFSVSALA